MWILRLFVFSNGLSIIFSRFFLGNQVLRFWLHSFSIIFLSFSMFFISNSICLFWNFGKNVVWLPVPVQRLNWTTEALSDQLKIVFDLFMFISSTTKYQQWNSVFEFKHFAFEVRLFSVQPHSHYLQNRNRENEKKKSSMKNKSKFT